MNYLIKLLELFGGIGAPRKALERLNIPVKSIDYVEIDKNAVKTYNAMFDNSQIVQDVKDWNLTPDILVHGSPCQDFSVAGLKLGGEKDSGTRSSLLYETLRIIRSYGDYKPRVVVWENVKNVLSKKMFPTFNSYLMEMESMGYTNSYEVLSATDFGLPQKRERVFTVSLKGKLNFDFQKLEKKEKRNLSEFLGNYELKHIVTQPSMLSRIGFEKSNKGSFNGRIPIITDECYTITCKQTRCPNSGIIDIGNGRYRYLTELECWRLQGFDVEDYYKALKANPTKKNYLNGVLYKQAGNSIPVNVLEAIFKRLKDMGVI